LCSDWWELTDEEVYTVSKFDKFYKDDKTKREIKQLMILELYSIAVVNYFMSSPELMKPSQQ